VTVPRRWLPVARVVPLAGPFDLDDVSAEVSEQHRAERAGKVACQVDDADVREGTRECWLGYVDRWRSRKRLIRSRDACASGNGRGW
jgi:hypothetical protein